MSKIAQKLSVDQIDEIVVELHSKDQSRTNQGFSYHDIYRIKNGTSEEYYMEPTLKRKIKTKDYNCKEERDMEQTTCLNHFYISKLNCTFPWLKSTKQSQEKCGSKHFIRDLVNLVEFVATGKYISRNIKEIRYVFYVLNFVHFLTGNNLPLEVEECLIPNCQTTTWKSMRHETYQLSAGKGGLYFVFDSTRKV